MGEPNSISIKPTITFLFSYLWLAMEFFLFSALILSFFETQFVLVFSTFMLLFMRLYWWLNFSSETPTQMWMLALSIPLVWASFYFEILPIYLLCYTAFIVLVGIIRITMTRYTISKNTLVVKRFKTVNYERGYKAKTLTHQHARGKRLNFACIILPVQTEKKIRNSTLNFLLFGQRNNALFTQGYRMDGIADHQRILQELKKLKRG